MLSDKSPQDAPIIVDKCLVNTDIKAWWVPVIRMTFDEPDQKIPHFWGTNSVRTFLPARHTWLYAFRYNYKDNTKECGVYITGHKKEYVNLIKQLEPYKNDILLKLPDGSEFRQLMGIHKEVYTFITKREMIPTSDEDEQREWLIGTLNNYANVFRPMIKQVCRLA